MNKNAKYVIWAIAAIAMVALVYLMFKPAGGGSQLENVSAEQAAELLDGSVQVVDVRTAGEFQAGRLPGAINLPVDQLATLASSLDPTKPVLVYCATGSRSISAVDILTQAGFGTIYHMNEGLVAWSGEVERGTAVASAAPTPAPETFESPVLYEFYTDW